MVEKQQNLGIRYSDLVEDIEASGSSQSAEDVGRQMSSAISIAEELIFHPEQKGNIDQVSTALHREGYRDLDKQAKRLLQIGKVVLFVVDRKNVSSGNKPRSKSSLLRRRARI